MMKKYLLIFLFIVFFISNYLQAQNIVAEVLNSSGGPYPKNNMCPNNSKFIGVKITNKGPGSLPKNTAITITVKVTSPTNTSKTFTEKFNTPSIIASGSSDWFTFVSPTNTVDLSKQGAYDFAMVVSYASDTPPTAVDGFDIHEVLYVAGNVVDLVSTSPDRSLCKSTELDTIAYKITYNADSAYASNLPPGVFATWKLPILKIFGKPTDATNSPYNYIVRATGTCPSIYDSILTGVITVTDLPKISYTGNNPVCEGFSSSASPSFGGTWKSTNVSVATISPNAGSIQAVSPGKTKFYFKTNVASACSDTLPEFTVNPLPVVDPITGPTKVCVNAKIQLTNTNKTGTWTSLNPTKATIDAVTGEVTGVSDGQCTIEYMVVSLGCTKVVTSTITVNKLPSVNLTSGIKQVCIGKTTPLTNGTSNGVWSSGTPATATISAQGLVTGLAAGSSLISYTVTDANNCSKSDTTTVRIYAYPTVNPVISGTKTICQNDSTIVSNVTPSGVWSSAKTSIATIDANGKVKGIAGGKSEISYVVTKNGCSTTVTDTITVNPLPVVDTIAGAKSVCIGAKSQLTNTTKNGVWDSSNKTVATINSTGEVTALTAGTTEISYTVTILGCITTRKKTITVFQMPSLNPITGITTVCEKATTTLSSSTNGGVWSSEKIAIATISNSGVVTGVTGGTSTIAYTVTENGCTTTNETTVTVTPLPIVPAITGPTNVCVGENISLTNTSNLGQWSSSDNSIAIVTSAGVVTGIKGGTVTINYTVTSSGCSNATSTIITVVNLPVVAPISGSTSICQGGTTMLTSTSPGGVWSSTNQSIATVSSKGLVTGISAGTSVLTYSLTINGCASVQTTSVTINAIPIVSEIVGNSFVCQGSTTLLSNATPGGTWKSDTLFVATIDGTLGNVKALNIGETNISYSVTQMGCSKMVTKKINVQAKENANFTYSSTNYCPSESDPTPVILGTKGGVFSAAPNGLSLDATTGKISLANSSKGNYAVTYKTPGLCSSERIWDIQIGDNSSNNLTITSSSGKDILCMGDSLKLIAQGATKYLWNTGKTDNFITVKNPGKYTVTSKDAGCSATASFDVKVDTLRLYMSVPSMVLLNNGFVTLNGIPQGGTFSGVGVKANTFDPKLAGLGAKKITFTYVSPNKCSAQLQQTIVVYDTVSTNCTVTKYDTVKVTKFDTLIIKNNVYDTVTITNNVTKYDTVKVTKFDTLTIKNNVYDTVTITNNVTKYDTVKVTKFDTITVKNNVYDTVKVTKFDTLTIKNNIYDTVTITNNVTKYDTVKVTKFDTLTIKNNVYDTVTITNNVTKYDTVKVTKFDTLTIKNNVYDTVTITNNVTKYDTVKVTKFDTITVTNNVTKYDTVKVTKYDTITVNNNIYDTVTITNNVTKYDTITLTDTVSILKIKFKLTTGIQANQMASMSVYPNPTTDVLHIEVGDAKALDGYRYRILDALGKEVYNELVKNIITEIPLKTLGAAGLYQLEVLDANKTSIQTNKIVLQ